MAGFYSVRQVSPYEEEYPTLDTLEVKAKFRGFTLNSEVGCGAGWWPLALEREGCLARM